MEKSKVWKLLSFLLLLAIFLFVGKDIFGQGLPEILPKDRANAIRYLKDTVENASREEPKVFATNDKYVRFMMAPRENNFFVNPTYRNSPRLAATWFLANWSGLFLNYSPRVNFSIIRDKVDKYNNHYVRYQQYYNGLEVIGAQMNCMVNSYGEIVAVLSDIMRNTESLDTGKVSMRPNISQSDAQKIAIEFLSREYPNIPLKCTRPELKILDPEVIGHEGEIKLVWETIVSEENGSYIKEIFQIDASNGEIVHHNSLIKYSNPDREIKEGSTVYRDEYGTYPPFPANHPDIVPDVWQYLDDVQSFYAGLGRNGWKNDGTGIIVYLNPYLNPANGSWGGTSIGIYYGYDSGADEYYDFGTDDIIGHEFTHGVFQTEIGPDNLYNPYGPETHAINESLADMFGEWIDQSNYEETDTETVKWKIGEDGWGDQSDWLRNMKNPTQACNGNSYQGAEIYEGDYWDFSEYPGLVGIYKNAGVGDKLCYLITDGDTFNNQTISGIEISDASELFYHCLCCWLQNSSDYHDLAFGLMMSAYVLELDCDNVANACRAVEIYSEIVFELNDSSGNTTAYIDDSGNLFLAGTLSEWGSPSVTANDDFIIQHSTTIDASIDMENGNMAIRGMLYDERSQEALNSNANNFVIKNNEEQVVAYIDTSGYLYLKGRVSCE